MKEFEDFKIFMELQKIYHYINQKSHFTIPLMMDKGIA